MKNIPKFFGFFSLQVARLSGTVSVLKTQARKPDQTVNELVTKVTTNSMKNESTWVTPVWPVELSVLYKSLGALSNAVVKSHICIDPSSWPEVQIEKLSNQDATQQFNQ